MCTCEHKQAQMFFFLVFNQSVRLVVWLGGFSCCLLYYSLFLLDCMLIVILPSSNLSG